MIRKLLLLSIAMMLIGTLSAYAEVAEHPVPMEGNTCAVCHSPDSTNEMAASPDAYNSWYDSLHGLSMVPCEVCHGNEANFRPYSAAADCVSCHSVQASIINKKSEGEKFICLNCHTAHAFTAPKDTKSIHK